tara:strand:+ start:426 stop:794 length:369 start_codon:yes stop_codon:yes gene_type:complete
LIADTIKTRPALCELILHLKKKESWAIAGINYFSRTPLGSNFPGSCVGDIRCSPAATGQFVPEHLSGLKTNAGLNIPSEVCQQMEISEQSSNHWQTLYSRNWYNMRLRHTETVAHTQIIIQR